jgi:hypothetical protein
MSDWASVRGDAAHLHTDPRNIVFRPVSVTAAVYLLKFGAAVNLVWGAVVIYLSIAKDNFIGATGPFAGSSDKFWFWYGVAVLLIGWLGYRRVDGVGTGESASRYPTIAVSGFNIVFGLLAFPWGMFLAVLGFLQFAALTSTGNEQWITKDVTQHG